MTSIVKVDEIQNNTGTTTLAKLENGQLTGVLSPATGFRNRIINGDMRIDQRNNGASVNTTSGTQTYIIDRWIAFNSSGATQSFSQEAISNAGFTGALRCTITNAVASGASAFLLFGQRIEGFNVSDLAWGTASAQPVTVSFQVFTSVAGTYGGIIRNGANNRFYAFSFTVPANTRMQVTETIPGDTSGTWNTDNSTGLELIISMGCGTSFQGATDLWGSAMILGASGQTQLNATAGATFQITGVQLEKGTVATPFEFRNIGQELGLCQRYYQAFAPVTWRMAGTSAGGIGFWHTFLVDMRTTPTVISVSSNGIVNASGLGFFDARTNGFRSEWASGDQNIHSVFSFGYEASAEL